MLDVALEQNLDQEPITIRLASAGDLDELRRLIDVDAGGGGTRHMLLDLTRPATPSRVLVAFAGTTAIAALHLDSGHSATDPFRPSATTLELLRTRAEQLRANGSSPESRRMGALIARLSALSPR